MRKKAAQNFACAGRREARGRGEEERVGWSVTQWLANENDEASNSPPPQGHHFLPPTQRKAATQTKGMYAAFLHCLSGDLGLSDRVCSVLSFAIISGVVGFSPCDFLDDLDADVLFSRECLLFC